MPPLLTCRIEFTAFAALSALWFIIAIVASAKLGGVGRGGYNPVVGCYDEENVFRAVILLAWATFLLHILSFMVSIQEPRQEDGKSSAEPEAALRSPADDSSPAAAPVAAAAPASPTF
jgi:hypothetical protein